jgi:hypothetical protein
VVGYVSDVENGDTAASLKRLLSDAYSLKAQILSSGQRYPESVHWARMAAALCVGKVGDFFVGTY